MRFARGGGYQDTPCTMRCSTGYRVRMHAWRVARRDAIPDRACCQRPTRDTGALGEDGEPAIEAFVYLDDDLRVAVAVRAR